MNHLPDQRDGTLRSWTAPGVLKPSAEPDDDFGGDASPPGRKLSIKLMWRAFRRHWWMALPLWGIGSIVLMALAYYHVKPSYDAVAQVRVEPGEQSLYTIRNGSPTEFAEFKETQVASVTSPVVLGLALTAHPELIRYSTLRGAEDPEAEIRRLLRVGIVPKTNLIEIAMTSESPVEAAGVVNAVLDAYLKTASNTSDDEVKRRIEQLEEAVKERASELSLRRAEQRTLSQTIGAADVEGVKDTNAITTDDFHQLSEQMATVQLERVTLEAELEQLRNQKAAANVALDPGQLAAAVRDAFVADPRVLLIQEKIDHAQAQIERTKRLTSRRADPARIHQENAIQQLNAQRAALWTRLKPRLERDVRAGVATVDDTPIVTRAEAQLAGLKSREAMLREKLQQMKVKSRDAGSEALQLEFARHDTERAATVLHKVEDMLSQLKHEARSPLARVRVWHTAKTPKRPRSNHRNKVMAMAPVVVLLLVTGLFVTLERRAGRVADPEELSYRARLQVLGVVPPLPPVRVPGLPARRDEFQAKRRFDEFVQSLDHLRVALCARPDPWGRDRHCVLITSACGSEGKTTLAAQLAERCVNAGLMTLLIDADLRSPSLSRMLDASSAPGLIDVLRGDTAPEDAMLVIGDAGGFHFLPAGASGIDPSRLLQGDALGKLLAQARESFEMIIVDAPPVLPVPDALTIGRWTDGAVLAVRYETSRFATVERAQQRLAHVGVPVLGAVVNGVRPSGSSYGGYYAYGGQAATDSPVVES